MERGYSDESILKILGGNTLRVIRAVERVSQIGLRNGFMRPAAVLRSSDN